MNQPRSSSDLTKWKTRNEEVENNRQTFMTPYDRELVIQDERTGPNGDPFSSMNRRT
jgi:hypothetical protein